MIREIKKEDQVIFTTLVKEFYNSEAVLHGIPENNIQNTCKELFKNSPYAKAYLIDVEEEVAGYALLSLTYSNEAGGLVVLLEELYIREQFRGMGLGNKMLDFIYSEYKEEAKRFRLEAVESNKSAQKLYLRKGFVPLEYMQMVYDVKEGSRS